MIYRGVEYGDNLDEAALTRIIMNPPKDVYFIRCEQYVKIGISMWPPHRLKQIRKGGGGSLIPPQMNAATSELIVTELGGLKRERELHAQFAHLRHTGEWFTEAPELTEYIETLKGKPMSNEPTHRIEWCGRIKVYVPIKPRGSK